MELSIARPSRVRDNALRALAFGVAAALALTLGSAIAFVAATLLFGAAVAAARFAVLGRRPVRVVVDQAALTVEHARPWSRRNVRVARAEVAAVEELPAGIGVRLRDGRVAPLLDQLAFEQIRFLERVLFETLQRT